jgi:hypothetical protein
MPEKLFIISFTVILISPAFLCNAILFYVLARKDMDLIYKYSISRKFAKAGIYIFLIGCFISLVALGISFII